MKSVDQSKRSLDFHKQNCRLVAATTLMQYEYDCNYHEIISVVS